MTLTWKDIRTIVQISNNLLNSLDYDKIKKMGEEGYFTEILNEYNEDKAKQQNYVLDSLVDAMTGTSGVTLEDMLSETRDRGVCTARYMIWEKLHNRFLWSCPRIGRAFNRNHSTVINGFKCAKTFLSVPGYDQERMISEDFERELAKYNLKVQ